jgi:hypothetical protein
MARRGGVARRCFLPGLPRTVTGGAEAPRTRRGGWVSGTWEGDPRCMKGEREIISWLTSLFTCKMRAPYDYTVGEIFRDA